jgi:hypothetical protein
MRFGSSYFRNDTSGLGADDQALTFADQTLISIVSPQGSLTYTEWATQTGDAAWTEVTPAKDYQAYAVSDFQLVAVANTASSEVDTLAVISPVLTRMSAVQKAFEGTPFAYDHTEAIYAQLDSKSPPQIYYCYWLTLRDASDPKTGPTSLNYAAALVLGVLSYIVQIPPAQNGRPHPASGTFPAAMQQQAAQGPITVPATPAVQTTIPATPKTSPTAPVTALPSAPTLPGVQQAAIVPTAGDNLKGLFFVAVGAGAAILGYRYVTRKKAS